MHQTKMTKVKLQQYLTHYHTVLICMCIVCSLLFKEFHGKTSRIAKMNQTFQQPRAAFISELLTIQANKYKYK